MEPKYFFQLPRHRLDALKRVFIPFVGLLLIVFGSCKTVDTKNISDKGFVQIFDGKSLNGWEGDPIYWKVNDGMLVGEVTPETLLKRNSFIIWRGGVVTDFELKVEYRVTDEGNSGINYRSEEVSGIKYALKGYQADLDGAQRYTGSNYEERRRTTLASRGEKVKLVSTNVHPDSLSQNIEKNRWKSINVIGSLGAQESFLAKINNNDWNEYHLIVKGNRLQHFVNGALMSDVTDEDKVNRKMEGLLGVQVHVGPPMKIEYKNFRLKEL